MNPLIISPIVSLLTRVIDKAVPDTEQANKLRAELSQQLVLSQGEELKGAIDLIKAEAQGASWLQRNWRPLLMLVIVSIVGNNYLIAPYVNAIFGAETAPILTLPERLWDLMTLGVGGYIAGRSGEKIMSVYKEKN